MKFLKGFLMAIGGLTLVIFVAALLFGKSGNQQVNPPVPQPSVAPSVQVNTPTPQPEPSPVEAQRKEATRVYWESWKTALESYKVAVELLSKYSVENSISLSSFNTQLADELGQASGVNVDPELAGLSANAVAMYRSRARIFQEQANIISNWSAFVKKRSSDEKVAEALLHLIFDENNRLAVPKALAEEEKQVKQLWNDNLTLLNQQNQQIQVMAEQRDALKIKLESKYQVVFEKF